MHQLQKFSEATAQVVEASFGQEMRNKFSCVDDVDKGRVLVSKTPVAVASVAWQQAASFSSKPALGNIAYETLNEFCEQEKYITAKPFVWAALCSLTNEQSAKSRFAHELSTLTITAEEQYLLLLLRGRSNDSPQRCTKRIVDLFQLTVSPELLQKLSNRWSTNCFEEAEAQSYMIMWMPSFLNHSCLPNLRVSRDDASIHSLVALRDISVGEELTLSYIDDMELQDCISLRRNTFLQRRGFECRCSLCIAPRDPTRRVNCDMHCAGDIFCPGGSVHPPVYDAFQNCCHTQFSFLDWKGAYCAECQRIISEGEMRDIAEKENVLWYLIQQDFSNTGVREIETKYGHQFLEWLRRSFSPSHFMVERVRAHVCGLWRHPSPSPQNSLATKWSISLLTTLQERLDFALLYPLATALQARIMSDMCSELARNALPEHCQTEVQATVQDLQARAAEISLKLHLLLPVSRKNTSEEENEAALRISYTVVNKCHSREWIKRISDVYGKKHLHLQDLQEYHYDGEVMVANASYPFLNTQVLLTSVDNLSVRQPTQKD
uniref:SET domain-containing protein n=1 Tax=viral metagenome TaxID=1070528 RepID=A0A6C0C2J3_9ZZZZ